MRALSCLFLVILSACAGRSPLRRSIGIESERSSTESLESFLNKQERISWRNLQLNISPTEPKAPGGPTPRRGVVVAARSKKDPDYYFHWVRDSAAVMNSVVEMARTRQMDASLQFLDEKMSDFIALSRDLQKLRAPHGLGEPRYTVEGVIDYSPWSRPQYDGPALRALTLLNYLDVSGVNPAAAEVLKTDLDYISQVYNQRGFDIWEEYLAENYHTRLVQLAALEKGAAYFSKVVGKYGERARVRKYLRAAKALEQVLDDHWDPARGFLRSQLAIVATDGYTAKKTDLDSAVIIAVLEADRVRGVGHTVLDDRVQATVAVLEDLFRSAYPINANPRLGLAYGRYKDDLYYGGNPWFLITAYYARFYYRLAFALQKGATFLLTKRNLAFARGILAAYSPLDLKPDTVIQKGDPRHELLVAQLILRGDRIMARLQQHIPADGEIFEQFDKVTGLPASSRGLGWGHASFLEANLARLRLRETR